MICGNCGYENPEGILYCQNCGAQLVYETEQPAEQKEGKTVNLLVLIFAAVVVIGCVIYLVFGKNKAEKPSTPTDAAVTATLTDAESTTGNGEAAESVAAVETTVEKTTAEESTAAEPALPPYSSEMDVNGFMDFLQYLRIYEYEPEMEIDEKLCGFLAMAAMTVIRDEDSIEVRHPNAPGTYVDAEVYHKFVRMLYGDKVGETVFENLGQTVSYKADTDEVYESEWGDASNYECDFSSPAAVKDGELTYEVCYTVKNYPDYEEVTLTYKVEKLVKDERLFYRLVSIESGNTVSE